MKSAYSEQIPFFSDLPVAAVSIVSRVWDVVQRPDHNGVIAYEDLVLDLRRLGISAPPRAYFTRWRAGVQAGLIQRPEPLGDTPVVAPTDNTSAVDQQLADGPQRLASAVKGRAERAIHKAKAGSVAPEPAKDAQARRDAAAPGPTWTPILDGASLRPEHAVWDEVEPPPVFAPKPFSVGNPAFVSVKVAVGRLLEEVTTQLSADIERTARENTARMLREVADELEGSVSA